MRKNEAVVFTGKSRVEFNRIEFPSLGANQVLIETSATLISTGTECTCLERNFAAGSHWDAWVKYPFYPGYSNVGRVIAAGADVRTFKVGDRIASRSPHQKYVATTTDECVLIPDGVSDEDAAWFGIACIVQNGVRQAAHELGDVAVIIGLGMLGQLAVQFVKLTGAREVIAIDTAPARLTMAGAHGATICLQKGAGECLPEIEAATDGRLADVVFDITGHPLVLGAALPLVRKFGKLILLGDAGDPAGQHLTKDVITRGLRIIGAHDTHPPQVATDHSYWSRLNMSRLFMSYLQRGQMAVHDLITHRFKPEQAREAYRQLIQHRAATMGVIFDWS